MKLQNRIEKLEQNISDRPIEMLITYKTFAGVIDGKVSALPIIGWRIKDHEDVIRMDGETDNQLQIRATAEALKASNDKHLTLTHIVDDKTLEKLQENDFTMDELIKPNIHMSAEEAYMRMLGHSKVK